MKPLHVTDGIRQTYTRQGYWGQPTTLDLWQRNARDFPHREAIIDSTRRFTWSQARQWYDRVALGLLELGLKRDDVVASQLPNMVETLLLMRALERAGILGLPTMTTLRHTEMEYLLQTAHARGLVILPRYRNFNYYQMVQELRPRLPDLQYIFVVGDEVPPGTISLEEMSQRARETRYPPDYLDGTQLGPHDIRTLRTTSGTTGIPKIIEYMNGDWLVGKTDAERWQMTIDDVVVALAPVIGGPGGAGPHWAAPHVAAKAVMMERFDGEDALRLIQKERITFASAVPAQMAQIVSHPRLHDYDTSSLRAFLYAGSSCPYHLAREVEEKMKCKVISAYGSLDIGRLTSASVDDPPDVRLLSVGKVYAGDEVKLVDDAGNEVPRGEVGEVVWRGPTALGSYYRDLNRTLEVRSGQPDGFIATGDLGKLDEQGNLYIVGRKMDIIIRGGQNISPMEIENLLITHPKVVNVAVVAMPDPVMVEKACAYVITRPGSTFTFEEMVAYLRQKRIAPYKLPERLEIVETFPMAGDGQKVDKRTLAQNVARKLKNEGKI